MDFIFSLIIEMFPITEDTIREFDKDLTRLPSQSNIMENINSETINTTLTQWQSQSNIMENVNSETINTTLTQWQSQSNTMDNANSESVVQR